MSLIRVRRTATLDSEAKDIQLPFIITFNNGKKEFREGYSAEEVRRRFDKGVAALYGGIKSVKLESEDKRDGKDSIAADANFKKGDKVTVKTKWAGTRKGIVKEVINDPALKKAYVVEIEGAETAAYPAEIVSADVKDAADADEFKIGTMVRFKAGEYKGKVFRLQEFHGDYARLVSPVGSVSIPKHLLKDEVSVANDSAEFHVGQRVRAKDPAYEYSNGKALGAGMFTVKEVNNNGDVKLDDYGDVWISPNALVEANDACGKGE